MNTQNKLVVGLMQIDNLISLFEGHEYQQFLHSHLIAIRTELKRQLTNLEHSSKITE